jgi:HAE1 family hydrophobic/amphiphilic exporter-1
MNDAQRKINAIINDLPDDAQAPSLNKFSLSDLPIMTIWCQRKNGRSKFYDLVDKKLAPAYLAFLVLRQLNITGGQEIQVNLDAVKCRLTVSILIY